MAGSAFGIGNPFATLGSGPYQTLGGPYQGIGSYNPAVTLPQIAQLLQIVPQQLQQIQQLEFAQQQYLQQIQQLVQVVAYHVQQATQQFGAQGSSLGAIAPQGLTSPFQTVLGPSAFPSQPLHVM